MMSIIDCFCSSESLNFIRSRKCDECKRGDIIPIILQDDASDDFDSEEDNTVDTLKIEMRVISINFSLSLHGNVLANVKYGTRLFLSNVGCRDHHLGNINHDLFEIRYHHRSKETIITMTNKSFTKRVRVNMKYPSIEIIKNFIRLCVSDSGYSTPYSLMDAKEIRYDGEYRDIINYIGQFACNSCDNNIGMSVYLTSINSRNKTVPYLNIVAAGRHRFELAATSNRLEDEVYAKLTGLVQALKSRARLTCELDTTFIYDNIEDSLCIKLQEPNARIDISYRQHGKVIDEFIYLWIESVKALFE
jgi:hypothetical protein